MPLKIVRHNTVIQGAKPLTPCKHAIFSALAGLFGIIIQPYQLKFFTRQLYGAIIPLRHVGGGNFPRHRVNRFILEYKKEVQVSMNWNEEKNVIIFDKLVSQVNDPHRKYTFVPSGQYDGLRWDNETWNYVRDLIPVTILEDGEAPSDPPKK